MKKIVLALLAAGLVFGCSSTSSNKKLAIGAGVGAAAGGVTGAVIGHQSGRGWEGAAIGAAVGGVGGAVVGHQLDKKDDADRAGENQD